MIQKIKCDPLRRWTNLNDYLLYKYGYSPSVKDITRGNPLRVDTVNEEDLLRIFGHPRNRTMCTGLNSTMDGVLNRRDTTVITKVEYRPEYGLYTVLCSTGWCWDARAFTPPIGEYGGIFDVLLIKGVQ